MPSTVIASYTYDPVTEVLRVRFVSGIVYEYKDVPLEVYQAMKGSYSKGVFLNKEIKPKYPCKRVNETNS